MEPSSVQLSPFVQIDTRITKFVLSVTLKNISCSPVMLTDADERIVIEDISNVPSEDFPNIINKV